ncbi:2'-5' RNA ligase family protein [Streptomyces sp. MAR4 CNX-425]|uniref:2'-5' RNA ligase family protein n=1 Tax=Streptomyces sp. MAR4 CNX-425 TaxID=3406343 RepID=UPI003B512CBB
MPHPEAAPAPASEPAAEGWPTAPGTTALSVSLPEVDPVVRHWRARYDTAAAHGGTAHVTVLYPFLHRDRVDAPVRAALRRLFAAHAAFPATFARCGRFPGVLYLVPEPDDPLRALTKAVVEQWPHHPPYGGVLGDVDPHLTVANSGGEAVHAAIEADLARRLPVTARVAAVDLVAYDGRRWRQWLRFPLGTDDADGATGATGTHGS